MDPAVELDSDRIGRDLWAAATRIDLAERFWATLAEESAMFTREEYRRLDLMGVVIMRAACRVLGYAQAVRLNNSREGETYGKKTARRF
jgi:hypothetical protein